MLGRPRVHRTRRFRDPRISRWTRLLRGFDFTGEPRFYDRATSAAEMWPELFESRRFVDLVAPLRVPRGVVSEKSALGALFRDFDRWEKKWCPFLESRTVKLPPWRSDRIRCLRDRRRVDRERPRSDRPNANRECFPLTWHVSPVNDDSTVKLSAPRKGIARSIDGRSAV